MDARSDDVIRIGSLELRFLVDETRAAGSVVVFEFVVPPNARVPAPHYHREVDEVVYVLDGTVTTTLDGRKHELRRGESLFVPRGSVHNHENFHPETARALITLTPGSIGRRYFEEVAREVNVPGKPDLAKIRRSCCGMVSCLPEGDGFLPACASAGPCRSGATVHDRYRRPAMAWIENCFAGFRYRPVGGATGSSRNPARSSARRTLPDALACSRNALT